MKQNNDGTVSMTQAELNAIIAQAAQAGANAAADEPDDINPAPTQLGKHYHNWRAERDAAAADAWDELGSVSPFGGGFCRFCGSIARGLSEHHRRGGFFSGN